jgi:hypothetical protein
MAQFEKDHLVLNFGVPWQTKEIQYLLWPVLGYRITAPIGQSNSHANLIESALLGLVRAGVSDSREIAGLLGIENELVLYICAKLMSGYQPALDSHLKLTEAGKRMLDNAEIETRTQKTGWIFQDPWTGEIWSPFVTELPTVPIVGDRNEFPEIDIGTEGRPFTTTPIMITPRGVSTTQPRPEDILRSVRMIGSAHNSDSAEDTNVLSFQPTDIAKIGYLESVPEPMYCLTAVVVDSTNTSNDKWSIRDPFQPGKDSIRLRRSLTLRFDEYPVIPRRIAKMLGIDTDSTTASLGEILMRADVAAELEVKSRFGSLADRFAMQDRLIDLEKKRRMLAAMGEHADFDQVPLACGKVAERVMKLILREFPAPFLSKDLELKRGKKCHQLLNQDTAKSLMLLGYKDVPNTLLSIDQSRLEYALRTSKGTLMPLTLAAVLGAHVIEDHPLKRLAKTCPDLLTRIGVIAAGRNPGAHDNDSESKGVHTINDAESLAEDTLLVVESILRTMHDIKGNR